MYTEPNWQKSIKWLGILLAMGAGLIVYVVTHQPVVAEPVTPTSATVGNIVPSSIIILERPTTDSQTLQSSSRVHIGDNAPDFTLPTLDKSDFMSLSQFKGQPVILNFWASWCLPCRTETPALERAYNANRTSQLIVIGVNMTAQDSIPAAQAFAKEFGATYPIVLDEDDAVSQMYSVLGLPTSLFINRQGLIQRIFIGGLTEDTLQQYLAEIVNAS